MPQNCTLHNGHDGKFYVRYTLPQLYDCKNERYGSDFLKYFQLWFQVFLQLENAFSSWQVLAHPKWCCHLLKKTSRYTLRHQESAATRGLELQTVLFFFFPYQGSNSWPWLAKQALMPLSSRQYIFMGLASWTPLYSDILDSRLSKGWGSSLPPSFLQSTTTSQDKAYISLAFEIECGGVISNPST